MARQWEAWGSTTASVVQETATPTVSFAVQEFLETQRSKNRAKSTYRAYDVMLNQRLLPYAASNGIELLSAFDQLHVNTKYIQSWQSLNPKTETMFLKNTTKSAELTHLSVAAKTGTSLAVEKEPVVGLRPDQV